MKNMLKTILAFVTIFVFAGTSFALDYDFSGNFRQDNDVLRFNFTVGAPSTVTIFSSSWVDGGFDPILAIWNSAGILQAQQDDGGNIGSTLSNGVSYGHGAWDSYYSVALGAGSYFATVAQYNNFAVSSNYADGFAQAGNPNFTFDNGWGAQPLFNGVWSSNDPRTSEWAFHILNVEQADVIDPNVVPEPSTIILFGAGLGGLAIWRRRKS